MGNRMVHDFPLFYECLPRKRGAGNPGDIEKELAENGIASTMTSGTCHLIAIRLGMQPLPKITRLFAILQLCLVFSLILWVLAQPFTVEYFNTHSSLLMYQTATGRGDRFVAADKLARHAERFSRLDPARQQNILTAYDRLEKKAQRPFVTKLGDAFAGLLLDLPAFTQAWIFFSIAICLLLLLGFEGAANAAWLLPVITLCYAIDNQSNGVKPITSRDVLLLPSEAYLFARYGDKKSPRQTLKDSWELYLIYEWAKEAPALEPKDFQLQVEAGEHALTVARVEDRLAHSKTSPPSKVKQATKKPMLLVWLFCGWNLMVASRAQKAKRGRGWHLS